MLSLANVSNFLISEWLWSVTWNWYHLPFCIVFMYIGFKWFLGYNSTLSALISLGSNAYAGVMLTALVVGVFAYVFNIRYEPKNMYAINAVAQPFQACLYLGIIYTMLQIIFLSIVRIFYSFKLFRSLLIMFVSNIVASFVAYCLIINPF